ncbi:hypothetical protein PUP75_19825 [Pseudomonas chlororaphis]|uniref:ApeA N-terminal domain 1-containing protein n=1 Tax=Pseudomonas chlororaphis TaxID=587753 RepID=UPI0023676C23|nr:HEPN domain-containing protein [Pseudomonas chlororaphis]WDH51188.1 hypothetical protein PUP75_19825 [Pseudomonas chlororaphis]
MQPSTKLFSCFTIDKNQFLGEFVLDGEDTKLHLSSRNQIPYNPEPHTLFGESLDHHKLSLYECVGYEPVPEGVYPNPVFKREVFPHFALIGTRHFAWGEQAFTSVSFKADDLGLLFSRRGTFGSAWLNPQKLAEVLDTTLTATNTELGDSPAIFYFTGRRSPDPINLKIGAFTTEIIFTGNVSNITGISCPAETIATLTYQAPKALDEIIDDVTSILDFIATVTGRHQGVRDITAVSTHDSSSAIVDKTSVHWSLAPSSVESSPSNHRDLPITPDINEEDFNKVFSNWIQRHDDWATARSRILRWQKHSHIYDENRLIAAANAFDILPDSTYPEVGKLSEETSLKKDRCKEIIMELKHGNERSQILGTLNFWGSKLLDKLLHKSKIVQESFNQQFQDLDEVLKIALKARNFYVHGSDYGHKHYDHLTAFLTDTLEFVFVASDLIECGWNASRWSERGPSFGHPMARFFYSYKSEVIRFNAAKKEATEN